MSVRKLGELKRVCNRLVKNSLLVKPREQVFVGLYYASGQVENVLDAHIFAYNLVEAARATGAEANLITLRARPNPLDPSDKVYNLLRAMWGFLHTPISKSVYGKFQAFVKELEERLKVKQETLDWLRPPDVFFFIAGDGYSGKDIIGSSLGFPVPSAPTERWENTIALLNKFPWYPQSKKDQRKPVSRTALTETLPLETYVRTLDIDYRKVAKINAKLRELLAEASRVKISGSPVTIDGQTFCTNLEIDVEGQRPRTDDGIFSKEDNFLNLPSGEVFVTPTNIDGTLVADGTIILDKSYILRKPLVISLKGGMFTLDRVVCFDKYIAQKLTQTISRYFKHLEEIKRKKSVSSQTLRIYEKNFYRVGEVGIGTNPAAKISRWLIESEKVLGTVHIAIGSGYEPEAKTVHHEDMVAGWKQPLTMEAIIDGKPVKILDKGRMVIA